MPRTEGLARFADRGRLRSPRRNVPCHSSTSIDVWKLWWTPFDGPLEGRGPARSASARTLASRSADCVKARARKICSQHRSLLPRMAAAAARCAGSGLDSSFSIIATEVSCFSPVLAR